MANAFTAWLGNSAISEVYILICTLVVVLVILGCCNNFFGWKQCAHAANVLSATSFHPFHGYRSNSPEQWTQCYPNATGQLQSPINLKRACADVVEGACRNPLMFNEGYLKQPASMVLLNDGVGVVLFAQFRNDLPSVSGGPLQHCFRFQSAHFRWGPTDDEGSEHTINSKRFALEMQMMHVKADFTGRNVQRASRENALLFVSMLFDITAEDNPYLAPLVESLRCIKSPDSKVFMDPFPFCWLFRPFKSNYYYYVGSITYPPCTEGVEWIIQQEPMSVSSRQMKAFRKLIAYDGPMHTNSRPVQQINDRFIQFYS